jgi:phage terminase Nu1 subunit (DNA packaging protein)
VQQTELKQLIETTVTIALSKSKHFPSIMTKKQVADYLGKPTSTINRWMREGMPFRKEGNDYPEFYRPHVDKWLEERFGGIQEIQIEAGRSQAQGLR